MLNYQPVVSEHFVYFKATEEENYMWICAFPPRTFLYQKGQQMSLPLTCVQFSTDAEKTLPESWEQDAKLVLDKISECYPSLTANVSTVVKLAKFSHEAQNISVLSAFFGFLFCLNDSDSNLSFLKNSVPVSGTISLPSTDAMRHFSNMLNERNLTAIVR